jgi:hypothetical protein
VDLDHQVHDYNPGIATSGLFWVTRVPAASLKAFPRTGRAELRVTNLAIPDFYNLPNALHGGPSEPATVSFDVRWTGLIRRVNLRDERNRFTGQFVENTATIAWSASQKLIEFESDPITTSRSTFALVGTERNGVFF